MKTLIDTYRRVFRKTTPAELAARELSDAELELLTAMTHQDYAKSLIDYNQARVKRLRAFLSKLEELT